MNIKERNSTADLLKGIAVILMIQVHIIELFATESVSESWIGSILLFLGGPPAAPVFMTVMGYYIAKNTDSIINNLSRGLRLIGLGLLLNFGLNLHLFIKIINGSIDVEPWPYLFGADILFLAGLSIIVIGILLKTIGKNPLFIFLLVLIIFFIQEFIPVPDNSGIDSYFWAFIYSKNWWSYFPLIPWLAYPLSGVIFQFTEARMQRYIVNKKYLAGIVILSGALLILSLNYGISIASNLKEYYHHGYMFLLFIWNFMIFWSGLIKLASNYHDNKICMWIRWLGKNVTSAYIIQWLIIGNIATGIYKTQSLLHCIVWFIAILIITSLMIHIWNKIRKKKKNNNQILLE